MSTTTDMLGFYFASDRWQSIMPTLDGSKDCPLENARLRILARRYDADDVYCGGLGRHAINKYSQQKRSPARARLTSTTEETGLRRVLRRPSVTISVPFEILSTAQRIAVWSPLSFTSSRSLHFIKPRPI